ncbi:hypothetical protein [Pseudoalteromonas sp. SR43-2]|uniref:hypothetical protein n=1 Tax=Pseudoalteromonas sp. SR43-2 TaxID=2760944 RepID=UPI0015FD43E3|nr:hypothetical protein [Pseudoalteromonas sp. SR43-2]
MSKFHAYVDFYPRCSDHVGVLLAGALKAQLFHIHQIAITSFSPTRILSSAYGDHVGVLLAGALKAQLLRIYQTVWASFTPTRIFHPRCSDHVGALLAGALKPPLYK